MNVPRSGYYNATLGTTAVAVEVPDGMSQIVVSATAAAATALWVGRGEDNSPPTVNGTSYGAIAISAAPVNFSFSLTNYGVGRWLYLAAATSTANVAVAFS